MARKKLIRITEAMSLPNIINKDNPELRNFINGAIENYDKIILEVGCGKGDYTIELARQFPDTLCVGVDIQSERLWRGATTAIKEHLNNVLFLRLPVETLV